MVRKTKKTTTTTGSGTKILKELTGLQLFKLTIVRTKSFIHSDGKSYATRATTPPPQKERRASTQSTPTNNKHTEAC